MIATYHNHTTYSDGKATVEETVQKAMELGVEELGISDHLTLHPSGRTPAWAMPPGRLDEYVEEIRHYGGMSSPVLRLGLEVDWFPNQGGAIRETLAGIQFDYLIGAVHEADGFVIDGSVDAWKQLSTEKINAVHRRYWELIKSTAESGLFDIVAHLDLPKKFGYRPTVDLDDVIEPALDAIANGKMIVEVNTAGWHKPVRDAYPSLELLERCQSHGIGVTISADAHEPDHLLRDFPRAAQRLVKAGYEEVARFAGRERTFEHIEMALARF